MLKKITMFSVLSIVCAWSGARANITTCSLNCAAMPDPARTLCLMQCMDSGIDNKINNAGSMIDNKWSVILTDTQNEIDATLSEIDDLSGRRLEDISKLVDEKMKNAGDMYDDKLSKTEKAINKQFDRVDQMLSPERAAELGGYLAAGAVIGAEIAGQAIGVIETGITWVYDSIHEWVTGDKRKAKLRENFVAADKNFHEYIEIRNQELNRVREALPMLDLLNSIVPAAKGRDLKFPDYENRFADLEFKLAVIKEKKARILEGVMDATDDEMNQKMECHRDILKEEKNLLLLKELLPEIERLAQTPKEFQKDPRTMICENLFKQVKSLVEFEKKIQMSRAALIQGHFAMRISDAKKLKELAGLGKGLGDFSDDATQEVLEAIYKSKRKGSQMTGSIDAIRASHDEVKQLLKSFKGELGPHFRDVVAGFITEDDTIRELVFDQACSNSPLLCQSLGVRDRRVETYWALEDLKNRCSDINIPDNCKRKVRGVVVDCDISDRIDSYYSRELDNMDWELLTTFDRIPPGTKLNPPSKDEDTTNHPFNKLINSL